jgi:hypothetical protein
MAPFWFRHAFGGGGAAVFCGRTGFVITGRIMLRKILRYSQFVVQLNFVFRI